MTYQEFLDRLAQTPRDWKIMADGSLRRFQRGAGGTYPCCPVTAVDGFYRLPDNWNAAADRLGLDRTDAFGIVCAADHGPSGYPNVRVDLLRACGLDERP